MSAAPEPVPFVGSRGKDRSSGIILLLLFAAALFLVGSRVWRVASGPLPPGQGDVAPLFTLPNVNGEAKLGLADLKGKVVLLDFWATWCPPCVASMPTLERLHRDLSGAGLVVLGVNQEPNDVTTVRSFLKERELSLPVVVDSGATARAYGVFSFPTSVLIDRDGKVVSVHHGPAPEEALRAAISGLLERHR
ncbi:MAG: TlpA disulfide reductase family protein [Myxococcota bacterium]